MRTKSVRMSRRWVPLAGAAAVTALVAGGSAVVLVQEDEEGSRPRVVAVAPPPDGDRASSPSIGAQLVDLNPARHTSATAPVTSRTPPRSVRDVVAEGSRPVELSAWVQDRSLEPTVRYSALRQLEQAAPAAAVDAAIACLDDITQLVRLNAIAVLARSDDPRAKEALSLIDARSQRLAQALVARR